MHFTHPSTLPSMEPIVGHASRPDVEDVALLIILAREKPTVSALVTTLGIDERQGQALLGVLEELQQEGLVVAVVDRFVPTPQGIELVRSFLSSFTR